MKFVLQALLSVGTGVARACEPFTPANADLRLSFRFAVDIRRSGVAEFWRLGKMKITELTIDRYDEVLALMKRTPGVSVREADSKEAVARYLARNPGLSFVAEEERIVGCAMCGHDGRRGYLQHVIVEEPYRRRGIAHALVTRCLDRLEEEGIAKTHIDVFVTNNLANTYWTKKGWKRRDDIYRYSFTRSTNPNA